MAFICTTSIRCGVWLSETLAVRKQESEKCHQLIELHVQDFQLWIERTQSSNFPSMVVELPRA
jgi:hypothetical protein